MHRFLSSHVGDYMSADVVSVEPETSLGELEQLFARRDFNALPVVEAGVLAGVVTKYDVLKVFVFTEQTMVPEYARLERLTAADIMTRDVITFPVDAPLTRILQTMVDFRLLSFPVVERGRIVGMIAREDIVRALRDARAAP
jgi:CBS domain-containing protein